MAEQKFTGQDIQKAITDAQKEGKSEQDIVQWLSQWWFSEEKVRQAIDIVNKQQLKTTENVQNTEKTQKQPQPEITTTTQEQPDVQETTTITEQPAETQKMEEPKQTEQPTIQKSVLEQSIQSARDAGLTDKEIQQRLGWFLQWKQIQDDTKKEWTKKSDTAIDVGIIEWQNENDIFQRLMQGMTTVPSPSKEYKNARQRYENFQAYNNMDTTWLVEQLKGGQLTIWSQVWNDLSTNGKSDQLKEAQDIYNKEVANQAYSNLLNNVMWFDKNKSMDSQSGGALFNMPDYFETLSEKYLNLLTDEEWLQSFQSFLGDNSKVTKQKEKIVDIQDQINEVNRDMNNIADDMKEIMIERGIPADSSIFRSMVADKSKPLLRKLQVLNDQYSTEASLLDIYTNEALGDYETQQNVRKSQIQKMEFLYGMKQDMYNKNLQIATSNMTKSQKEYFLKQNLVEQVQMFGVWPQEVQALTNFKMMIGNTEPWVEYKSINLWDWEVLFYNPANPNDIIEYWSNNTYSITSKNPTTWQYTTEYAWWQEIPENVLEDPYLNDYINYIENWSVPRQKELLSTWGSYENFVNKAYNAYAWFWQEKAQANNYRITSPSLYANMQKKDRQLFNNDIGTINSVISKVDEIIQEYSENWVAWPLDFRKKREQKSLVNDLLVELKEQYNLGVLNWPDLDILTAVVPMPWNISSKVWEESTKDIMINARQTFIDAFNDQNRIYWVEYVRPRPITEAKQDANTSYGGWTMENIIDNAVNSYIWDFWQETAAALEIINFDD